MPSSRRTRAWLLHPRHGQRCHLRRHEPRRLRHDLAGPLGDLRERVRRTPLLHRLALRRLPPGDQRRFQRPAAWLRFLRVRGRYQRAGCASRDGGLLRRDRRPARSFRDHLAGARLCRAVDRSAGTKGAVGRGNSERHLVHLGRREPVGRRRRRNDRARLRDRTPGACAACGHVLVDRSFPVRRCGRIRHAAAHALQVRTRGTDAALLGVDGGHGRHGPRGSTHRRDGGCADSGRDARAHRDPVRRLLGVRDLVDPGTGRRWLVAPRRSPSATTLRRDPVERRLPARHIRRRRDLPR